MRRTWRTKRISFSLWQSLDEEMLNSALQTVRKWVRSVMGQRQNWTTEWRSLVSNFEEIKTPESSSQDFWKFIIFI